MVIQQELAIPSNRMAYFGNVTHTPAESFHMELYSVVLSVTMLSLSLIFGSGGNLAMLISLCSSQLIKKFRYIYIVMLLIFSSIFDLVWCPMEMVRLLWYHQQKPTMLQNFEIAGQTLYLFLLCTIGCSLLLISIHATLEIMDRTNRMTHRSVNIVLLLASFLVCFGFSLAYGLTTLYREKHAYHITYYNAFLLKVVICTVWILVLSLMVILILAIYKRRGQCSNRKKSLSELSEPLTPETLNIPTLLIKEADDTSDTSDADANKTPEKNSTKKIVYIQDMASNKEDKTSAVRDLPSPSRTKNHLGVNMAAILGRRRHTIGQIGETGLDLIQKAKQYNYVRKFSVDINALQAQLENPKIHAEFPFRSDTELQKVDKQDKDQSNAIKSPPTPLLHAKLKESEIEHISEDEEDKYDSDNDDNDFGSKLSSQESSPVKAPTELTGLKSTVTDGLGDSKQPVQDFNYSGDRYSFKLAILLIITFTCCILPMYITETVLEHLSKNAYINILTCTMALSVVQTIIYPQIIFCMDTGVNDTVNKVFTRFRGQFMHMCYGQQQVPTSDQIDISVTRV